MLESQIRLLDDPDNQVYALIHNNIVALGIEAIPILEKAWEDSLTLIVHERIENIIHEINVIQINEAIENWVFNGRKDWFDILYLFSKFYFQNINKATLLNEVTKIKKEIWLEINDNLTAFEKIQIINHFLYKKYKYKKSSIKTQNPNDYFLSQLVSNKKGNDLILGLFYLLICNHLELPVYGVDLPGNFILAYMDSPFLSFNKELKNDILFYINPANNGMVFGPRDIDIYLEKNKLKPSENYYLPANNLSIINRYVNELIATLEQNGELEKISELEKIKQIINI